MKKLLLIALLIVGCDSPTETDDIQNYPFYEYDNFSTINGTDEYGNQTQMIGNDIASGCYETEPSFSLGRVSGSGATASLIKTNNTISISADALVNSIQMTFTHGDDFIMDLGDNALASECNTQENTTTCVFIGLESDELFTFEGDFEIVDIIVTNAYTDFSINEIVPGEISLGDAYPNPFSTSISLSFNIPESNLVEIFIVDTNYNKVATLLNTSIASGMHEIQWDANDEPSAYYRSIIDFGYTQCFINLHKAE